MPMKRDLSDLAARVRWARSHDDDAHRIANNARNFVNENLLPQHVICYHAVLLLVSRYLYVNMNNTLICSQF